MLRMEDFSRRAVVLQWLVLFPLLVVRPAFVSLEAAFVEAPAISTELASLLIFFARLSTLWLPTAFGKILAL